MDHFDNSSVYMTELALVPESSSLRHSRFSHPSSDSNDSDGHPGPSHSRNISLELSDSYLPSNQFAAPGSVSPSSDLDFSYPASVASSIRGRRSLHRQSSSYGSTNSNFSSFSTNSNSSSFSRNRFYSKPPSPSLWLSNAAARQERSPSPSSLGTFCSGVARPVRVHHFSVPSSSSSGMARPGSAASLYTVQSIDTTSRPRSADSSPQIYSCEFAQEVKLVRVTLPVPLPQAEPVSPPTRPVSRMSSISDRESISTLATSSKSDLSSNPDQHHKDKESLRQQHQVPKRLNSPKLRSSRSSMRSVSSMGSEYGRCPSRASMVSDVSTGFSSRPTTPLSVLDENGDPIGDDEYRQSRKKWRWLNKAKTKSRYFMGLISEAST